MASDRAIQQGRVRDLNLVNGQSVIIRVYRDLYESAFSVSLVFHININSGIALTSPQSMIFDP